MDIFANRVLHSRCGAVSLNEFGEARPPFPSALLRLSTSPAGYLSLGFLCAHRRRMLRRFLLPLHVGLRRCLSLCWPPRFLFAGPRFSRGGRTPFRFPRSRALCKFRCGLFPLFFDLFLRRFFDTAKVLQPFSPGFGVWSPS